MHNWEPSISTPHSLKTVPSNRTPKERKIVRIRYLVPTNVMTTVTTNWMLGSPSHLLPWMNCLLGFQPKTKQAPQPRIQSEFPSARHACQSVAAINQWQR